MSRYLTRATLTGASRIAARSYAVQSIRPLISANASISSRSFSRSAVWLKAPKSWDPSAIVTYEELKPITEQPNDDILLIDVREPEEVAQGNIPSSVNLPLTKLEHDIKADDSDFQRVHGFPKPAKDQAIIVYCRSGVRSQSALEHLRAQGYKRVRNYKGSWLDWSSKDVKKEDD